MTLPLRVLCLIAMDLIRTPISFILYYRPPAKKQHPSPASANHRSQCISGILPNWEHNRHTSSQPVSAPRHSESSCKSYFLIHTMLLLTSDFMFEYKVPHSQPSKYTDIDFDLFRYLSTYTQQLLPTARVVALRTTLPMVQTCQKKKSTNRQTAPLLAPHRSACLQLHCLLSRSLVSPILLLLTTTKSCSCTIPCTNCAGNLTGACPSHNENSNVEEDTPMDDRSDHNGDNEDGRGNGDNNNGRGDRDNDNGRGDRDSGGDGRHQQGQAQTKQPTKLRGTAFKNTLSVQPKVCVLYLISLQVTNRVCQPPVKVTRPQMLTRKPAPTSNAAGTSATQGMLNC